MDHVATVAAINSGLLSILIALLTYIAKTNNRQGVATALALKDVVERLVELDQAHAVTRERLDGHLDWSERTTDSEGYPRRERGESSGRRNPARGDRQ